MSNVMIGVEGIGKRYRIGPHQPYQTLRDIVTDALHSPLRYLMPLIRQSLTTTDERKSAPNSWLWALKDVSFEVKEGEVLGIIGRNGAGKSTLLKLLSRITKPTEGYAEIHGRVGSLLEVGTGFHPELTGRENIYLNGAILGMKKAEIERKFDEIVAFAGTEKFIDTPLKHYSSGMYMRLAFAVAAHLEPEILVVDEVLAVGDAEFQQKCLNKMGDVAKKGRTILFVSHNLLSIQSLCRRVIWLQEGKVASQGAPGQVISDYLRASIPASTERFWSPPENLSSTEGVRLHCVRVRSCCGTADDQITVRTPFQIEFDYWNSNPSHYLSVSFRLYNEHEILLFDICPPPKPDWRQHTSTKGLLRSVCYIPGDFLNNGLHRVSLIVLSNYVPIIEEPTALVFNVQDTAHERDGWYGEWPGAIRPTLKWETNLLVSKDYTKLNIPERQYSDSCRGGSE